MAGIAGAHTAVADRSDADPIVGWNACLRRSKRSRAGSGKEMSSRRCHRHYHTPHKGTAAVRSILAATVQARSNAPRGGQPGRKNQRRRSGIQASRAGVESSVAIKFLSLGKVTAGTIPRLRRGIDIRPRFYSEITAIVRSHVSTSQGHLVIGKFVRRSPKPCLPSANRCISAGTPAFFSAM